MENIFYLAKVWLSKLSNIVQPWQTSNTYLEDAHIMEPDVTLNTSYIYKNELQEQKPLFFRKSVSAVFTLLTKSMLAKCS